VVDISLSEKGALAKKDWETLIYSPEIQLKNCEKVQNKIIKSKSGKVEIIKSKSIKKLNINRI